MKQHDDLFESMSIAALQARCASGGSSFGTELCLGEPHDRH
ncbi:hypothetical protein [Paraburkholderia polaris]|nr:hypothetical protein [Paraburkholderia polaris]